jgi:hypothetical protein
MAAADIPTDLCQRGSAVVSADGTLSNTGQYCSLDFDADGQKARLEILPTIRGEVTDDNHGHSVAFADTATALQLRLDGDISVLGGAIMKMASPKNTSAIDVRTESACIRVYSH